MMLKQTSGNNRALSALVQILSMHLLTVNIRPQQSEQSTVPVAVSILKCYFNLTATPPPSLPFSTTQKHPHPHSPRPWPVKWSPILKVLNILNNSHSNLGRQFDRHVGLNSRVMNGTLVHFSKMKMTHLPSRQTS